LQFGQVTSQSRQLKGSPACPMLPDRGCIRREPAANYIIFILNCQFHDVAAVCRCEQDFSQPDGVVTETRLSSRLVTECHIRQLGAPRHRRGPKHSDHESITPQGFPKPARPSRKEARTAGPYTAARYPRATSRGRRAVAGEQWPQERQHGADRSPPTTAVRVHAW